MWRYIVSLSSVEAFVIDISCGIWLTNHQLLHICRLVDEEKRRCIVVAGKGTTDDLPRSVQRVALTNLSQLKLIIVIT